MTNREASPALTFTESVEQAISALTWSSEYYSGKDYEAYVATLTHLRYAQDSVEHARLLAIRSWVESGASWSDVGLALGMSKQAAWERFSKRV